jgi:hypothetical protein
VLSNLKDAANSTPTLQQNDILIVAVNVAGTTDVTQANLLPTGYTAAHTDLYSDDTNDTNLQVSYKVMGASPDTTVSIPAATSTANGVAYAIYAFRNVDTSSPLDVTTTTASAANTGVANAPAITPSRSGAWIMAVGAAGVAAGAVFTNPTGMSATTNHFRSATITTTTVDANIGVALKTDWSSGSFDPAVFGGSTSTNTGSWAAVTLALRPLVNTSATGLASETSTGFALATAQIRAAGMATASSAALALGTALQVGRASANDNALALGAAMAASAGLSSVTAMALALGMGAGTAVSAEAGGSQALGGVAIAPTGTANDNEAVLTLIGLSARAAGLATASEAALAVSGAQLRVAGAGTATESGLALAGVAFASTGRTDEMQAAFGLSSGQGGPVDLALSAEMALPLGAALALAIGTSAETAIGLATGAAQQLATGLAMEAAVALALELGGFGPAAMTPNGRSVRTEGESRSAAANEDSRRGSVPSESRIGMISRGRRV